MKIKTIKGREILDSRGNPTIEVDVILENGIAELNINLYPNTYIITSINPLNGEVFANNITYYGVNEGDKKINTYSVFLFLTML